jgi:hypothetical protein
MRGVPRWNAPLFLSLLLWCHIEQADETIPSGIFQAGNIYNSTGFESRAVMSLTAFCTSFKSTISDGAWT